MGMNSRLLWAWAVLIVAAVLAGCDGEAPPTVTATSDQALPSAPPAEIAPAPAPPVPAGPALQLALNWKPEPQFGGFYAAASQGFFASQGLNVELLPGGSGTPVVQMVAAGKVPYGIASGDEIVIARSRGQDVVALFAVYQTCPQGILVRADRGLTKLEQVFSGGTLAMQRGLPYSEHLATTYGLDRVKVVPYAGGVAPLLDAATGATFSQQCFVTSEPILLRQQGVEPRVFLIADSGYNPYTTVLITRGDYARANEGEVHRMIAAVHDGWTAYLDDPAAANAVMLQLNPTMDPATMAESAAVQKPLIDTGDTAKLGLGAMTIYRWQLLVEQLLELGVIDKPVPAAALFLGEPSPVIVP